MDVIICHGKTMREGINKVRAANFRKASDLKKQGYASAVHALPPNVKSELDRLLLTGTSVRETLRAVSNQFPEIKFPSVNALNNYKNKHLGTQMSKDTHDNLIALNQTETEMLVDKLKKSIGQFYVQLADTILPKLVQGLEEGLEKEKMVKMPMKMNTERTMAIASLVREMNNFTRGNGINILAVENKTTVTGQSSQEDGKTVAMEDVYDKLARILTRRGLTITHVQKSVVLTGQ